MSGMLFLMFVQSMFQFGAKGRKWEGYYITGRKIILTCPFVNHINIKDKSTNIHYSFTVK